MQQVKPDMFYLRNEQGKLVYVPDFSYEHWERLVQIERNLANPDRPAYVIKDMVLTGSAKQAHLELDAKFTIERHPLDGQASGSDEAAHGMAWVRIPLRFSGAYLRAQPRFEGPGNHFLTYEGLQDGYICWIESAADTTHQVSLPLVVPLERVGDEQRFALHAPAPLASSMTLHVAENPAEGVARSKLDEVGHPLGFTATPDGQGQLATRGVRGDVVLSWHPAHTARRAETTRLDVFGTISVSADEQLPEVRSEGQFVVRSFGRPLETFRVRLPPGMQYRDVSAPGYTVQRVEQEETDEARGQLVEVRLDRPAIQEATIRLTAELPLAQDDPAWPLSVDSLVGGVGQFEPARFVFEGAARHRGHIDFTTRGDWTLQWEEDPNIPREEGDSDTTGNHAVSARFRYFTQPCALSVSIREKATRVSVEPNYEVFVDAREVRLNATLACRTSGSNAAPLELRMKGWTVETVRFEDIDTLLPIDYAENDPLVVPIPLEAQATGKFRLRVEARQDLTAGVVSGTQPLYIVLPLIETANPSRANLIVSPAAVEITPAENVALTPRKQELHALAPFMVPSALQGTTVESTVFRYRDRGSAEQASFVGDFKVQPRSISVSVSSTADMDRRSLSVEQQFDYAVLHEAVSSLTLRVPASLVTDDRVNLRILLDDKPLTPTIERTEDPRHVIVNLDLPQPALGSLELRVLHLRRPMPPLTANAPTVVSIPLVFPSTASDTSTTIISNTLAVTQSSALRSQPEEGPWVVDERESTPGRMRLITASDGADAEFRITLSAADGSGSTVVDQSWVQCWFAGTRRRDRAVFRLHTNESRLRIRFPNNVQLDPARIRLAVDHVEVKDKQVNANGQLTFPVGGNSETAGNEHVVEVWYEFTAGHVARGRVRLNAATIAAADRAARSYWQLVLPRDELLLWGDRNQTADLAWQWQRFGWWRQPAREQLDLEQWIGATKQAPVPPATNRYVFTSFGMVGHLEVVTASRAVVLLLASGTALISGLLLVYIPVVRHPACLLVIGVALMALGLIYPEPAMLAAQAASLGLVLVLIARLLRSVLRRSPSAPGMLQGRSALADSKTMEVHYVPGEGSSKITATTSPVPTQIPAAESKS